MIEIGRVEDSSLAAAWCEVLPMLEERGESWKRVVDFRDVFQRLVYGDMDLWIAHERGEILGVVLASWERHAHQATYHINYFQGSRMREYFEEGLKKIEHYAQVCGATYVNAGGRVGWQRMLAGQSYKREVFLQKNVRTY